MLFSFPLFHRKINFPNRKKSLINWGKMNSLAINMITHLKLLNFARVCNTIYKRILRNKKKRVITAYGFPARQ